MTVSKLIAGLSDFNVYFYNLLERKLYLVAQHESQTYVDQMLLCTCPYGAESVMVAWPDSAPQFEIELENEKPIKWRSWRVLRRVGLWDVWSIDVCSGRRFRVVKKEKMTTARVIAGQWYTAHPYHVMVYWPSWAPKPVFNFEPD